MTGCSGTSTIEDNSAAQENPTTTYAVVFKVTQSGGCVRLGPNCAEHTLRADGSVEVKRIGPEGVATDVEARRIIDQGQVDSWANLASGTDFDALKSRLPEGSCSGCVDGIDYVYTIYQQDNSISINSLDYEFSEAEPFIAMTNGVYDVMFNAAMIEMQQRGN